VGGAQSFADFVGQVVDAVGQPRGNFQAIPILKYFSLMLG
jgi:hypothetical protein